MVDLRQNFELINALATPFMIFPPPFLFRSDASVTVGTIQGRLFETKKSEVRSQNIEKNPFIYSVF
jgi:hypothetical protein